MKKIVLLLTFVVIFSQSNYAQSNYATIYIGWPITAGAAAFAGGAAVMQYCDINAEYATTIHMREYAVFKVDPGTYNITLYSSVNKMGWGGWSYGVAKQKNISKNYSFSLEPGQILYISPRSKVILNEYAFKSDLNQNLLATQVDDINLCSNKNNLNEITQNTISLPSHISSSINVENENHNITPKTTYVSQVDKDIPISKKENLDTYVLIIANESYQHLSNVNFATNDGNIFKQYCVNTLGIPEKQIRYCQNATYGNLLGSIDWLTYALNNFPNSNAIVYYCGHGIPDEKTGQAFLVPVDGTGKNTATCYSLSTLYKTLASTKAQSITYFMDACFTGANKDGSMLIAARGVAIAPKKEVLAGNTVVFSASSSDETAMTLEKEGHGLFTYYLLKKLKETKGEVTYSELADYINLNVKKDAFLINEKPQTPIVAVSPAVVNTWKNMKLFK